MADTEGANGSAAANEAGQESQSISVLAQYIKDLSFENPNAPNSLAGGQQPQVQIQVNVNGRPLGGDTFEVELMIEGSAGSGTTTVFKVELSYGGVLRLSGIPEEHAHAAVMIEGPRLMFPFARQIIADAVRNGGFPPLMIDPIDFVALYRTRLAQQAAEGQTTFNA